MLRWVGDAEDNFDVGVKRGEAQVIEICPNVKVKFVVGGHEAVFAKQSFASAVVVGKGRADLMPRTARCVVSKLRKLNWNVSSGAAKIRVEDVRRDAHC